MPVSRLQQQAGTTEYNTVTSMSQAPGTAFTAGSLIVVNTFGWRSPEDQSVTTVSDPTNGAYTLAIASPRIGSEVIGYQYYKANNTATTAATVTVTWDFGTSGGLSIVEYSGVKTSPTVNTGSSSGTSTTPSSGAAVAAGSAVYVAAVGYNGASTTIGNSPGGGFSQVLEFDEDNTRQAHAVAELLNSTGSQTCTWTLGASRNWTTLIAAYEAELPPPNVVRTPPDYTLQITRGYSFGTREQLTPQKLNNLLDLATVTNFGASNFAGSSNNLQILTYGNTAPPLVKGALWYNTTTGAEGLYWAFVSASNGSVAAWLCATPSRDMIGWASSNFSAGTSLYVGKQGHAVLGHHYITYDGTIFPLVWPAAGNTGPHPALVVPKTSVSTAGPVVCTWAGFTYLQMGNSPVGADGKEIWVDHAGGNTFRDDSNLATTMPVGVGSLVSGGTFTLAPGIFHGRPSYEKFV